MIIFNSVYHSCSIYLKLLHFVSRIVDSVKILQRQIWYNSDALSENVRSLLYDVTQASRASFLTPIFVDRLSFWGNASCLHVLIVCISSCSHVSYEWRYIKFLRGTRLGWETTRGKEAHRWLTRCTKNGGKNPNEKANTSWVDSKSADILKLELTNVKNIILYNLLIYL